MSGFFAGTLPGTPARNGRAMDRPYLSRPQRDMLALAARTGRVRLAALPRRLDRTPEQVMHTASSLAATGMAVIDSEHDCAWLVITAEGRQAGVGR